MPYIFVYSINNLYNYISVFKFCSNSYYILVQEIKKTFNKNFIVKGCYCKFYYPQKFSQVS